MPADKEPFWKDGLYAAMKKLEDIYEVSWHNLQDQNAVSYPPFDFILGWGAFNSPVDRFVQSYPKGVKKGLCLAGNSYPPVGSENYDIIFYETEWARNWLLTHPDFQGKKLMHAFGINAEIYYPEYVSEPIFDYLTVGSFSLWKRQHLLKDKPGIKMAIGEIQKGNLAESIDIIGDLLLSGVAVSDMVSPQDLAEFYRTSEVVYIPADLNGGGERAVLEARACDVIVEVEDDNPKLKELKTTPIVWDHHYYATQLERGIEECLRK